MTSSFHCHKLEVIFYVLSDVSSHLWGEKIAVEHCFYSVFLFGSNKWGNAFGPVELIWAQKLMEPHRKPPFPAYRPATLHTEKRTKTTILLCTYKYAHISTNLVVYIPSPPAFLLLKAKSRSPLLKRKKKKSLHAHLK